MFGDWLRSTGFLRSFALVLFSFSAAALASADEPGAEFKLRADDTLVSRDHQVRVEPYTKDMGNEGFPHQFAQGEDKPAPWIVAWHCVYDLKTRGYSVPPVFAEHDAKALKTPRAERK